MKYIREPFATGIADPFLKRRFPSWIQSTSYPRLGIDEAWMMQFNSEMFSGSLRIEWPWNVFARSYSIRTDRIVVKLHSVKHWLDWYNSTFPTNVSIYLVRHPIPQAISSIKWRSRVLIREQLSDEAFRVKYLTPDMVTFAYDRLDNGSELEQHVVTWCLENLVPLCHVAPSSVTVLTYEELVVNNAMVVEFLKHHLGVSGAIQDGRTRPSRTVGDRRTRSVIQRGEGYEQHAYLLGRWQRDLTDEERGSIQTILDVMGITGYSVYHPFPNQDLVRFPSTLHVFRELSLFMTADDQSTAARDRALF